MISAPNETQTRGRRKAVGDAKSNARQHQTQAIRPLYPEQMRPRGLEHVALEHITDPRSDNDRELNDELGDRGRWGDDYRQVRRR